MHVWGMTKLWSTAARQNISRFINSPALFSDQRGAILWIQSIGKASYTHIHRHLHYISSVLHGSVGATAQGQINTSPTHCHCPERNRREGERERRHKHNERKEEREKRERIDCLTKEEKVKKQEIGVTERSRQRELQSDKKMQIQKEEDWERESKGERERQGLVGWCAEDRESPHGLWQWWKSSASALTSSPDLPEPFPLFYIFVPAFDQFKATTFFVCRCVWFNNHCLHHSSS